MTEEAAKYTLDDINKRIDAIRLCVRDRPRSNEGVMMALDILQNEVKGLFDWEAKRQIAESGVDRPSMLMAENKRLRLRNTQMADALNKASDSRVDEIASLNQRRLQAEARTAELEDTLAKEREQPISRTEFDELKEHVRALERPGSGSLLYQDRPPPWR